jgi:hypothetical protein
MRHRLFVRPLRLGSALVLALLLTCAHAVELGEPAVRSYIGQPLIADIELSGFAGDAAPVQVKLAHPDVYRGASIRVHPVLASLNMSVMRRDGRQFLHLTTLKPVDTEYVHVFLELSEGGRRSVRGATLWLSADPQPAPPPAPVPVAVPAPAPVAARVEPAPARALSCPRPQFTAAQIKTCATLDYKNAMLSAQIVELEEKVKLLQMAMEARPRAAALAAPPPIRTASKSAPAAAGPKAAGESGMPWLRIGAAGAAVLVVLAGAAVFFAKRRAKGPARTASAPGFMARLRERLKRDKKADAAASPQEPHT